MIGKNNPMHSTFYNYRVEFQVRGALHVHGVLWINYKSGKRYAGNNRVHGELTTFKTLDR